MTCAGFVLLRNRFEISFRWEYKSKAKLAVQKLAFLPQPGIWSVCIHCVAANYCISPVLIFLTWYYLFPAGARDAGRRGVAGGQSPPQQLPPPTQGLGQVRPQNGTPQPPQLPTLPPPPIPKQNPKQYNRPASQPHLHPPNPQYLDHPPTEMAPAVPGYKGGSAAIGGHPKPGAERVTREDGGMVELTPLYRSIFDRPYFHIISRNKSREMLEKGKTYPVSNSICSRKKKKSILLKCLLLRCGFPLQLRTVFSSYDPRRVPATHSRFASGTEAAPIISTFGVAPMGSSLLALKKTMKWWVNLLYDD